MAVIGSFKGASIIGFPTCSGPKSIEFGFNDATSTVRSPYTGIEHVQLWPGGDYWDVTIALPQMPSQDAQEWTAFLMELRGRANVFYLGDPLHAQPLGKPQGLPVVSGVNKTMSTLLNTKGWLPNTSRLLLPGDQFQLGTHLYRVLNVVASDATGLATLNIWPSIREATTDGQVLVLANPKGLFRLAENRRSVMTDETRLSGISFKAVEAR